MINVFYSEARNGNGPKVASYSDGIIPDAILTKEFVFVLYMDGNFANDQSYGFTTQDNI